MITKHYPFKCRIWGDEYGDGRFAMHYPESSSFHITQEGRVFSCSAGDAWGIPGSVDEHDKMIALLFIGLQDKNKKDLYDGDVVDVVIDGTPDRCIIMWQQDRMRFGLQYLTGEREEDSWAFTPDNDFTLVGNIYENPELLKA
ncbi:MAG TPA: YopX family protein [Flavobacteriales bacterium]|nr:YopX family protein [Flavobacteriales bacterium]